MDNMDRDVTKLWLQVLAGEKHAYRVSNGNIIADGRLGDYVYNQVCIENNKVRLYEFIDELDLDKNNLEFYDLLKRKDGSNWTKLHQKLDFLASMLNAANILEYEENPLDKKNKNPKIKILSK